MKCRFVDEKASEGKLKSFVKTILQNSVVKQGVFLKYYALSGNRENKERSCQKESIYKIWKPQLNSSGNIA